MRKSMWRACALLLTLSIGGAALAQNWNRTAGVDAAVKTYMEKFKVPAMSVAVIQNGQLKYCKGFGIANPLKAKMADGNTAYRLASMSKSLTGVLAEDLVQRGKLSFAAKIRTIVPSLPAFHQYTVEQSLSHLGGVRHYAGANDPCNWQTKQYLTLKEALGLFQMSPPVSTPGEKYNYSTPAFTVAGAAIEKRAGLPFMTYAALRFREWGFPGIHPEMGANAQRADIWKWEDGKNKMAERDNISWKYPGGGFEASVKDLALFAAKLMNGGIINSTRMADMWTARKTNDGKSTGYGIGWAVGMSGDKKIVDHSGSQNGANSYWRLYPTQKVAVVILSNRSEHNPAHLGGWLGMVAVADPGKAVLAYSPPSN